MFLQIKTHQIQNFALGLARVTGQHNYSVARIGSDISDYLGCDPDLNNFRNAIFCL